MKTLLLSTLLLFLTGCWESSKENVLQKTETQHVETSTIPEGFSTWVRAVNSKKIDSIKSYYGAASIKIISSDSVLTGSDEIAQHYALQPGTIQSISSLFAVEANKQRDINYEFIKYETNNGQWYAQLLIWRMENGKKLREFEFTSNISEETNNNEKNIAERRNLWIELCNAHNPENLVNMLYSQNSMYFNHKPLIIGQQNLIEEYAYMKNENYTLTLDPLKMLFVNDNLVFEIGQCNGTYNGKYILVWKKETDGAWRVFIDSNV